MDITAIPFHRYLGLDRADPATGFLVTLLTGPQHTNHLGTIHASVLIALAEAGSGAFLLHHFENAEVYLPIIRRMEAKFHQAGQGRIFARCTLDPQELGELRASLKTKGRAKQTIPMEVVDESGAVILSVAFDWFVAGQKD